MGKKNCGLNRNADAWRSDDVRSVCVQQPLAEVLGVCSHVPLCTSCSRPNRSGFTGFFQPGTPLSSTGGRVWNGLWEQQENLFMPLFFIFLSWTALLFSKKSRNTSSLVLLRVQMVPVIWPEFPANVRLNWAQAANIILHIHFNTLHILNRLFFAICPIIFVGCIQTTDLLHPTPSCHLLPGSTLLVRGQLWTGSTHVWTCCHESPPLLFFRSLKLAGTVNNIHAQVSVPIPIPVFSFYNLYAASAIEWIYCYFLNRILTKCFHPFGFSFKNFVIHPNSNGLQIWLKKSCPHQLLTCCSNTENRGEILVSSQTLLFCWYCRASFARIPSSTTTKTSSIQQKAFLSSNLTLGLSKLRVGATQLEIEHPAF